MEKEKEKKNKRRKRTIILAMCAGLVGFAAYKIYKKYNRRNIPLVGVDLLKTDNRKYEHNRTTMDKQYINGRKVNVSTSDQYLMSSTLKVIEIMDNTARFVNDVADGKIQLASDPVEFITPKKGSMHVQDFIRYDSDGSCGEGQYKLGDGSTFDYLLHTAPIGIVNGINRGKISYKNLGKFVYNISKAHIEKIKRGEEYQFPLHFSHGNPYR